MPITHSVLELGQGALEPWSPMLPPPLPPPAGASRARRRFNASTAWESRPASISPGSPLGATIQFSRLPSGAW